MFNGRLYTPFGRGERERREGEKERAQPAIWKENSIAEEEGDV